MPRADAKPARPFAIVLSCEHGGNRVPAAYAHLFRGATGLLETHRGYDRGALPFARALARRLRAPLFAVTTTRLLVDQNRSPGNPSIFSRYARRLSASERERLLRRHYAPPRGRLERAIERALARGQRVIHLAVHSFTPVLRGRRRALEIGLLYDPKRTSEHRYCARWQAELRAEVSALRVRRNAPYRGSSDGVARALRRRFRDRDYLGLEIELNQGLLRGGRFPAALEGWIADAFARTASALGAPAPRSRGRA